MKYSTHNTLVLLVIVLIILVTVTLMYIGVSNQSEDRIKTCEIIGSKIGLDFYAQSNGKCGWGESCQFQCKFIDSKGDIVIKNVQ